MTATRWVPPGQSAPIEPVPLHERDWAWRNRLRGLPVAQVLAGTGLALADLEQPGLQH